MGQKIMQFIHILLGHFCTVVNVDFKQQKKQQLYIVILNKNINPHIRVKVTVRNLFD